MKTALAAAVLFLLAAPATAQQAMMQQPTMDDMHAAYEAAVTQRNHAADGQIEISVATRKIVAAYEVRLDWAMGWLKAAQVEADAKATKAEADAKAARAEVDALKTIKAEADAKDAQAAAPRPALNNY